jgi:Tol biopolymer transport system component
MRGLLIYALAVGLLICTSCKDNVTDAGPPCGGIDPLIVPESPYDSPIWHPSGQFIGFNHTPLRRIEYPHGEQCPGVQHFAADSAGFWLINSDGGNMRRIFPYKLQSPAWSPDGNWIAFVVGAQIFKMRFTGMTFDTSTVAQLTFEGRNFFPAWSPDGRWIAFDSNDESPNGMQFLWVMRPDGSLKSRIAYDPAKGEIRMPSYSPDGREIVHIRYLAGVFSSEIFVMDSNGTEPSRLTFNNSDDRYPKYSPDGMRIAFYSNGNIWLMDTLGNNQQQFTTSGVDASFGVPFSWSPAGDKILYTRYRPTDWTMKNGVLWMINVSTKSETQFTSNP